MGCFIYHTTLHDKDSNMKLAKQRTGLDDGQVLENRKIYGDNKLVPPKRESKRRLLTDKLRDPLIIILFVAMALSFVVAAYQYFVMGGSYALFLEPTVIAFAVVLAISVSFFFERKANRKLETLYQDVEEQMAKVIRKGNYCAVPKNDIVVGDIVILEAGDEVPADGILLESVQLAVNESVLTGEPMARKGVVQPEAGRDSTYPSDRIMRGSIVVAGHGVMKVTMVGKRTEYGKVYEGAQRDNKVKTPLNLQLKRLSNLITTLSYIAAGIVIIGRAVTFFTADLLHADAPAIGAHVLNTIMLAVTVVVVAVPEGLPMSVSLSLAMGMRRMLSTNNLVRKMHACETMGAATVVCTDKTGTLTQNMMRVSDSYFLALTEDCNIKNAKARDRILASIIANSTANLNFSQQRIRTLGNPTEAAMLLWLHDKGIDYRTYRDRYEIVDQSAFSTERKYMGTVIRGQELGRDILLLKGAPEILMDLCSAADAPEGSQPLTADVRSQIDQTLAQYQHRAMRTLGFAYAEIDSGTKCFESDGVVRLSGLTFMGVVGIIDPVRPEVPEAVRSCLAAGIKVKIVTGDTLVTSIEVARQIGLWAATDTIEKNSITGAEFAATDNETILRRLDDIKVMSRARPMDKSRLVHLLQQKGEVVAVTGDGTNDAPALNAAQVGLSMGDSTAAAKHASAITILDNSFRSINQAVLLGRSLYRNIQRFIIFQLIINIIASLVVICGAFFELPSALTVTQMLWVNLILDTLAAIGLASLPPDERLMGDAPRNQKGSIVDRSMFERIVGCAVPMFAFLQFLLIIFLFNDITSATDLFSFSLNFAPTSELALSPFELSLFFSVFVLMQFWNLFNAKAYLSGVSAFKHLTACPVFMGVVLVILIGQILIVTFGGRMFGVVPLSLTDWAVVVMGTSTTLIFGELSRLMKYRGE